ncbi:MAG TPA: phosphomannomutase/phosphoglucomutase [bacterium]|nr:phosphomannomutase/phosphoglucomutase [bacterium]
MSTATVPAQIFREYDIRGLVDSEITPEVAGAIARAFAAYLSERGSGGSVVIGRDNRLSSPRLRDTVLEALTGAGRDVVDLGVVITPVFYFARVHLGIDGGVMITASHNPPEYNGMKLATGPATLYGEEIQHVRRLATGSAASVDDRGRLTEVDVVPAYRKMLQKKIVLGPRSLRVAVDCGNGTASLIAPDAIEAWGCETLRQHCESDPTFPHHHPDPVKEENVRDLVELVRREQADCGIGFDGDGDRLGVVDDQGRIIWGDELMALFWREILPRYPGSPAIIEVKCSQALVEEVERLGGRPLFYRTGHSLIKAKMRELGAVFTGEMSGHMFFADEYYGYDDAVYAAGRLLRILSHADRPLSALLASIPRYPITPEVRVDAPDDVKFEVVRRLTEAFKRHHEVVDVDGARILFPSGWGLIRASNTQPALVLRAEAHDQDSLERIKREIGAALAQFPEVGRPQW